MFCSLGALSKVSCSETSKLIVQLTGERREEWGGRSGEGGEGREERGGKRGEGGVGREERGGRSGEEGVGRKEREGRRGEEWDGWSCASPLLQVGLRPGTDGVTVSMALTVGYSYWSPPLYHWRWPAIPDRVSTGGSLCDI